MDFFEKAIHKNEYDLKEENIYSWLMIFSHPTHCKASFVTDAVCRVPPDYDVCSNPMSHQALSMVSGLTSP